MMIGDIVSEPLRAHGLVKGRSDRIKKAEELLVQVGLRAEFAKRYPHEFSGGQRQRIGIARAIATNPRLIILDEPISALDISVRAQILNLLEDLQDQRGLAYLFIAHDLSVVRHACDRVSVMYLGINRRRGPSDRLFAFPSTRTPRRSWPRCLFQTRRKKSPVHPWKVTYQLQSPFHPAAASGPDVPSRRISARFEVPPLRDLGLGQFAACHFAESN